MGRPGCPPPARRPPRPPARRLPQGHPSVAGRGRGPFQDQVEHRPQGQHRDRRRRRSACPSAPPAPPDSPGSGGSRRSCAGSARAPAPRPRPGRGPTKWDWWASSSSIASITSTTVASGRCSGSTSPGTRCTPSTTVESPSTHRAIDDRRGAHRHLLGLLHEAEQRPVALVGVGHRHPQALPGLERRVVQRGHQRGLEEGAHDLAHGVGRGDPADAQAVGQLGGERALAGAGGAADQQHQRTLAVQHLLPGPEPGHRALALLARASTPSTRPYSSSSVISSAPAPSQPAPPPGASSYERLRLEAGQEQRGRHPALGEGQRMAAAADPGLAASGMRPHRLVRPAPAPPRPGRAPPAAAWAGCRRTRRGCRAPPRTRATTSMAAALISTR